MRLWKPQKGRSFDLEHASSLVLIKDQAESITTTMIQEIFRRAVGVAVVMETTIILGARRIVKETRSMLRVKLSILEPKHASRAAT